MKRLVTCFVLLSLLLIGFAASASFAETVNRFEGESAENFAKRNGPAQSGPAHAVIEAAAWGGKKNVIAF
jgi:hypothetical protein